MFHILSNPLFVFLKMNFYSEDIVNDIIDFCEIEDILETTDDFYKDAETMFCYFSMFSINVNYTKKLIEDRNNKMAFLCMDTEFRIGNCPTGMIYTCQRVRGEIVYFILVICTKHQFKNMGYASIMLNQFIDRIRAKKHELPVKIVLSSLDSAVTYYESYGFKWTRDDIRKYPTLLQMEKYEEDKDYFVMELVIS